MKQLLLAAALLLIFAFAAFAQETCTRHAEAAGGFSYCPPADWTSKASSSGGPYMTFKAPPSATFTANMNVKEEATPVSHNDYVAASIKKLLADQAGLEAASIKLTGWTDFATAANLRGSRLTYQTEYRGLLIRTVQYVFDRPGKKLIITGTALDSEKAVYDKLFDTSAKSLRFNR